MKRAFIAGALAAALAGCVAVPIDNPYGYAPSYPSYGYSYAPSYPSYDYSYAPYYGYGYGFDYAPWYWGPPVILSGAFLFRDFHGHSVWDGHRSWGGGNWSGGHGNWGGGHWSGGHGGRR